MLSSSLLVYAASGLVLFQVLYWTYRTVKSPLKDIPGPFAARLSRLWYLHRVSKGNFEADNIALHMKYGKVVRIAPDWYSIDDPAAIKQIYGIGTKFRKSDWYFGWQHPDAQRSTLFSERDIQLHARERRKFSALFSTSSLLNYEPYVNQCCDIFSRRLSEFATSGSTFDMGHWFQCYAFDVIACITYSSRFGFLDRGEDVDGAIAQLWRSMRYSTLIGIFPSLHPLLFKTVSKLPGTGPGGRVFVMKFVQAQIDKRKAERKKRDLESGTARARQHVEEGMPEDFLEKMMNAHEEDPGRIDAHDVFITGLTNIIAGSDTTAVSLSSVLYHLIKTPRVLAKLREEISAVAPGEGNITFKQSLSMPYFQAVMKEALRMHPATGLPLWRVVPAGGATIFSHFFPAGTVIGVNTWTAHYNTDVFGADAVTFRPERWLESSPEKVREMDAYYMPFGLGSRTCIGRHISELEMSKLIPRIVREFDFEIVGEAKNKDWKVENYWFVKPTNFEVRVRMRRQ